MVNFHGYGFGKKGIRSKIELLENLRDKKGLNKKKANILAGNFNFVEHKHDRKSGTEEAWSKEKNIRDLHSVLTKNFSLYVRFPFVNKFFYISVSLFEMYYFALLAFLLLVYIVISIFYFVL